MSTKQKCRISRHILDAGCYYEEGAFTLSFLPRRLPELFTARFTPSVDFTEGDVFIIKGRRFTVKTRTMEEPAGKLFSAGAVVQCDIDMERNLAFVTTGGEAQGGGVANLGTTDPKPDGTASAGSSTNAAREDHVHPSNVANYGDYSLNEKWTGYHWIDGKKIYKKTIYCGGLPNAGTHTTISPNIENLDIYIKFSGTVNIPSIGAAYPLPCIGGLNLEGRVAFHIDSQKNIAISCGAIQNSGSQAIVYATLFYTCKDR